MLFRSPWTFLVLLCPFCLATVDPVRWLHCSFLVLRLSFSGTFGPGPRRLATQALLRFWRLPIFGLHCRPCTLCMGRLRFCTRACGPLCLGIAIWLSAVGRSSSRPYLPLCRQCAMPIFLFASGSWSQLHTPSVVPCSRLLVSISRYLALLLLLLSVFLP